MGNLGVDDKMHGEEFSYRPKARKTMQSFLEAGIIQQRPPAVKQGF